MFTRKFNILLVDGNRAGKIITEEILKEAGIPFNLSHVLRLKDAISHLCKEKEYSNAESPDLIILEAGLLHRDNGTWTKQIRSDERFKKIPSVTLILFKEEETYFRSLNLPVDRYLVMPIDLTENKTIIHELREFAESISLTIGQQSIN